MEVRDATADPEVGSYRIRLTADQARRTTLETAKAGAGILNYWSLVRQITRDDEVSWTKLRITHRHLLAAASRRSMMTASRSLPVRMAVALNSSAV